MKKIINDPRDFVDETIASLLAAHPEIVAVSEDKRALAWTDRGASKRVGIVTGGGFGHFPLFLGYVGRGLCTAVAVGNVFSSPSAKQVLAATRAADAGGGVLFVYGNYGGDVLNFDLGREQAELDGITVNTVIVSDDVFSAPTQRADSRRGVAGMVLVFKVAGAAAERGDDLQAVTCIARRAADATRSAGVGLAPTILPTTGKATFTLEDNEMEIGVGIHGEPGTARIPIAPADSLAERLLAPIVDELNFSPGDHAALLVNGLGATPPEELYLLAGKSRRVLEGLDVIVSNQWVGEFATSLEMAGASITVMKLDKELQDLLTAPADAPLVRF